MPDVGDRLALLATAAVAAAAIASASDHRDHDDGDAASSPIHGWRNEAATITRRRPDRYAVLRFGLGDDRLATPERDDGSPLGKRLELRDARSVRTAAATCGCPAASRARADIAVAPSVPASDGEAGAASGSARGAGREV